MVEKRNRLLYTFERVSVMNSTELTTFTSNHVTHIDHLYLNALTLNLEFTFADP